MASSVFDLDLAALPESLEVPEGHAGALILVRLHGHPVGQARLPNHGELPRGEALRSRLVREVGWPLWRHWLHSHLDAESAGPAAPRATVAITTRDRPEDLQRCLTAVASLPDDGQEVLVIDNDPSDDAGRRVTSGFPGVRYVVEPLRGSSAARNRALREARNEIVAFTDDDAVPDRGWLRSLVRNFADARVKCVTGLTMPLELETEAQEWFESYCPHGRGFSRLVFDARNHDPLDVAPAGVSANMALRRSVLDLEGGFDTLLGAGTPCHGGEDYDLFARLLTRGHRIVYEPSALSWHRHRADWSELRKQVFGYGVGVYAFWTRQLLREGELRVPQLAWRWLRHKQLPNLWRCLRRRPGVPPADLLLAELRGCLWGPWRYLASRRRQPAEEARA